MTDYKEKINNEFEEWYRKQPFKPGQDARIKEWARSAWFEQQAKIDKLMLTYKDKELPS